MAKQEGPLRLSGKIGKLIHSTGGKGKAYTRQASQKKIKNKSEKFIAEKERTALLNRLCSRINIIFKHGGKRIKPGVFYSNLGSRMREEKSCERILLLDMLRGMEVNEKYKLETIFSFPTVEVTEEENWK